MSRYPRLLAPAGALICLALGACGPATSTSTAVVTSTSTTSTATLDSCLVGDWVSTGVKLRSGSTDIQVTGGENEKVTITSDGKITVDDSNSKAITVPALHQTAKQQGKATGTVTPKGPNAIHVQLDSGNTLATITFDENGMPTGTPSPAKGSSDFTYSCQPGATLSLITGQSTSSSTGTSTGSISDTSSSSTGTSTDTGVTQTIEYQAQSSGSAGGTGTSTGTGTETTTGTESTTSTSSST
jgi:hypothetical protein